LSFKAQVSAISPINVVKIKEEDEAQCEEGVRKERRMEKKEVKRKKEIQVHLFFFFQRVVKVGWRRAWIRMGLLKM
jgi:hypothetical protein